MNDGQAYAQTAFTEVKPAWNPNEAEGQGNQQSYRKVLMEGLKEGKRKA
jgi:hypothetical protein